MTRFRAIATIVALLATSPALAPTPAAGENLTGLWAGSSRARARVLGVTVYGPVPVTVRLDLSDQGGTLGGTVRTTFAGGPPNVNPVKGRFSAGQLSLSVGFKLCDGSPTSVSLSGRLNAQGQIEVAATGRALTCAKLSGQVTIDSFTLSRQR